MLEVREDATGGVEGELEIKIGNECGLGWDATPFMLPYIIFDIRTISISLTDSTMTLSSTTMARSQNKSIKIESVKIMTPQKKTILTQTYNGKEDSIQIDISSLPVGKYYVQIIRGGNKLYKKLVIE